MAQTNQPNSSGASANSTVPKRSGVNWSLIQNIGLPVLTLLSGFGIGYLNFKTTNQTEIDASKAQQAQYEDEIRKERSDFLEKYVPQLMSHDSETRRTAEALLFTLSTEEGPDAQQVLEIIKHYEPAIDIVPPAAISNQQWGIVLGESPDSSSALDDVNKAHTLGFTSVQVNKIRDNDFQTVITGYKTKSAAMTQSFLARAALRDGARVENLNSQPTNNIDSSSINHAPKK